MLAPEGQAQKDLNLEFCLSRNLVLALQHEQSVAMYPVASCEAKNECTIESAL